MPAVLSLAHARPVGISAYARFAGMRASLLRLPSAGRSDRQSALALQRTSPAAGGTSPTPTSCAHMGGPSSVLASLYAQVGPVSLPAPGALAVGSFVAALSALGLQHSDASLQHEQSRLHGDLAAAKTQRPNLAGAAPFPARSASCPLQSSEHCNTRQYAVHAQNDRCGVCGVYDSGTLCACQRVSMSRVRCSTQQRLGFVRSRPRL